MNKPGVTKKAVYERLKDEDATIPSYSQFRKYTIKHGITLQKKQKPHIRFETKPGEQLQVDWKENIRMKSKHGEVFDFLIFSQRFEKDLQTTIRFCRVKSPEAKGKVESSNRFLAWLRPYDGEFEDEAE